jgi:squalene synthase HpnC
VTSPAELALADRWCRGLLAGHYENFLVVSPFLPRELRPHFARLYAYCRTVDDLGDESAGDAEGRLRLWSEDLERCVGGADPVHPVLVALADTVRRFELDAQPFRDLIAANRQDQQVDRYRTWPELQDYCRHSAAPVGRVVLRLFGVRDGAADALSDDVCIGLQLANFAQDVRVDAAKGRTYLLQGEIGELGTRGAVRRMCERAAALLRSGRELEGMLPSRPRAQVMLYRLGGEAILEAIGRIDHRTDERRPQVSLATKARLLPVALLGARGGPRRPQGATDVA